MAVSLVLLSVDSAPVLAQSAGARPGASQAASARVETAPLELSQPDRFQVPLVLEPLHKVALMATDDGIVQSLSAKVGEAVRERQEVVQLDRTEATARLKIARAEVKERQADLIGAPVGTPTQAAAQARVEAAEAQAELAQLALDRCTLRAPFAGVVLALPVAPGQYVARGTTVAELADVSGLRVLVPVDRTAVTAGASLTLEVEGTPVSGRITALIPLPDSFAALHALPVPWSAAWVEITDNSKSGLQAGQRVRSPDLPTDPIAAVPTRAVQGGSTGRSVVQVLRNEHVTGIPVQILGETTAERVQVAGPFRSGDLAIIESSVPLAEGTFLRFGTGSGGSGSPVELAPPDPNAVGAVAETTPPPAASPAPVSRVAPIGAPDSALPTTPPTRSTPATAPTATRPAAPAPPPRQAPPPATVPGAVPF